MWAYSTMCPLNTFAMIKNDYYTQRDWDRVVGWGTVPKEYQYPHLRNTDEYRVSETAKHTKKILDNEDKA